ncbi:MAG: PotD/PotF family extracellular solute-binding protein [Acutalibacteraceae bacterium]
MKKIISVVLCLVLAASACISLTSCGKNYIGEVNVFNWGENISNGEDGTMDVIAEFEEKYNIKVNYTNYETNEELYNILTSSNSSYDVIIPSDYMIAKLIKEDLLAEINFDNVPNYKNIMSTFKDMPFDPENKYSVPYTWGVVALVYNTEMVTKPVDSWDILWDEEYSKQILMIDNSRDAMAIAMQMKGIDPNNLTKEDIDVATDFLKTQKPLVKKYVMDMVFTEMEGDQAAVAVYYAGDIISMMRNNDKLAYALPKDGTNRFVDSACIPKNCNNKEYAEMFINFLLEPEVAKANSEYIGYSTPNQAAYELLDEETRNNELAYPSEEYLEKCFYFTDLPTDIYNYMQEQFLRAKA